jgi:signal peptidase I
MFKASKARTQEALTPEQVIRSRLRRLANREDIASFIRRCVCMVVLIYAIFGVFFGVTVMKNNDMYPKLSSGDLMLYYRLQQRFRTQDLIIFEKNHVQYVGRIVAKGGDEVEITEDSRLRVNNSTVNESDIFYSTPRYGDEVAYPMTLEEDQFFILCDYRDGARDSRFFGAVDQSEIKGKVITVIRRSSL